MKVQITLKSGAQIVVDVERFSADYDGPSDRFGAVRWKHAATGGNLLAGVLRSEIAAAVLLDCPAPEVLEAVPAGPVAQIGDQLRFVGDEDGGVSIDCRVCDRGGLPIAYLCPYPNYHSGYDDDTDVAVVGTIADLLAAGARHLFEVHPEVTE